MRSLLNWWWWRLDGMVVVVVVLMVVEPVTSQSPRDTNKTLIRDYCSYFDALNKEYFLSNLNTTLSSLRRQLSGERKLYAVARTVINGESVWGLAACREYVSNRRCVACFDTAVAKLKECNINNGGRVFYDDCDLRYENSNFYAISEPNLRAPVVVCGNYSASQPTQFRKTAERLLADLQKAAPRTSNFYAASSRQVAGTNETVYAFGQCNLNLSQRVCAECLKIRYTILRGCLPISSGKAFGECFMRYSGTPFFGANATINLKPFLYSDSSNKKAVIGGVVGGVGFLMLVLAFLFWYRRSRKSSYGRKGASTGTNDLMQGPMAYNYNDLKIATNNFDEEHKLGGGLFGEVYKGVLKNGDIVAIKRIAMASRIGTAYFQDQLKIISNVHHRHLIRMLGYSSKGPQLFLVLEYMENGSLDKFLSGEKRVSLNWKQRFDIIFGIARGLAYLHEQYHVTIIHRDIKSSNILLDDEFQPKISDFGLMRLLPEDKTHLSTKFGATIYSGFVAPEYAIQGQLSEKVDTYSFAIVVLEIISGKRYHDMVENRPATQNPLDRAWNLYESGNLLSLIDDKLDPNDYVEEDAKKIIEIALMCTQSLVSARPTMTEVVTLLSDKAPNEKVPIRSMTLVDHDAKIINVDTSTSHRPQE